MLKYAMCNLQIPSCLSPGCNCYVREAVLVLYTELQKGGIFCFLFNMVVWTLTKTNSSFRTAPGCHEGVLCYLLDFSGHMFALNFFCFASLLIFFFFFFFFFPVVMFL